MNYELLWCDALMAAVLAFFSATRLAMRTLKWEGKSKNLYEKGTQKNFNILVFSFLLFLVVQFTLLKGEQVTATLETEWCN